MNSAMQQRASGARVERRGSAAAPVCSIPTNRRQQTAAQRQLPSRRAYRQRASRLARVVAFKGAETEVLQSDRPAPGATSLSNKQKLYVSWAGAGIFFFWQLGAMKYLAERYDLTRVPMVGASGGALAAVLAACGVEADRVIQRAYEMSVEQRVWERPMALVGMYGSFIEKWLDEMLPDDAHERCRGRVTVVVTTLPKMTQVGINDFKDKKDLINACMASAHVPFFLDFKLARNCRGRQCVDGSFPDFFTGLNSDLLRFPTGEGSSAVIFDYFEDPALPRRGRMDMLEVKSYDEIRKMYSLGYEYAQKLHSDGKFDQYHLAEVLLSGDDGGLQEVLVPSGSGQFEMQSSSNGSSLSRVSSSSVGSLDGSSTPARSETQSKEVQAGVAGAIGELASEAVEVAAKSAVASQDSDPSTSSQDGSSHKHRGPRGLVVDVHQGLAELAKSLATTATATAAGISHKAGSHHHSSSGSKGPWWFSLPRLFGKQSDHNRKQGDRS